MKTGQIKKLLKVEAKNCSNCGSKLVTTHSRRKLKDLNARYFIDSELKRCINKECSCNNIRLYPEEYKSLIYPNSDYSLGVYAVIGHQRLNASKSVSQIRSYLEEHYPSLGLKERSIERLYKRVQVCLRQRQEDVDHLRSVLDKKPISQLCLALDGIAPEQGNAILYVVREVQSQEILFARYLEHSDLAHLKTDLLLPLKAFLEQLDIPVGGWLCDKQNGFLTAIGEVFKEVPIHLCQAHFMKAMGKPVQSADRELGKDIKKKLRPLKQIEKDLGLEQQAEDSPLSPTQKECLRKLCLLPRTWISRSLNVTYELRGVQLYEQLSQAIQTIEKMAQKQSHPLLERLRAMLEKSLEGKASVYEDLREGHAFLGQLTDILYGKKVQTEAQKPPVRLPEQHRKAHTAAQLQQQVEQLLVDFEQEHKARSSLCREFIQHFKTTYESWKAHLFTCYEYDFIPNDNNDLESNHNQLKRRLRKMTGNKSTARPLLVYGEDFVLAQSFFDKSAQELLLVLSEVDFKVIAQHQAKAKAKQQERGLRQRLVNRTQSVLDEVFDNW